MYKLQGTQWKHCFHFVLADLLLLQIILCIPFLLGKVAPSAVREYLLLQFIITLCQVCAIFLLNPYSDIHKRGYLKEMKAVFLQITFVFALTVVVIFLSKNGSFYSRLSLLIMYAAALVLTYFGRIFMKKLTPRIFKNASSDRNVLLVTTDQTAEEILQTLQSDRTDSFRICGIVLLDSSNVTGTICGVPVVATAQNMLDYIVSHVVDEVFFCTDGSMHVDDQLMNSCVNMGVVIHYGLESLHADMSGGVMENFGGYQVITRGLKLASARDLFFKRVIDIVGSLVGLFITGIAALFVAPAIYIKSPGPIFFSQTRVGLNGRPFKIYKFRSMYMDAEKRKQELMEQNKMSGLMFKIDDDPRIIKGIGTFIRKSSIDELPQMWNVLKGDMSLVGTRPPTMDEYRQYEHHHKARLATKPGITGVWQVNGRSDITDFEKVVQMDNYYIQNWSIGLDIKLILKTVLVVFRRDGSV